VVNDSGVYLPVSYFCKRSERDANGIVKPSPPEKKGLWPRRSNVSSATKTSEDIEHFSISRESFDSYRRSFVRFLRSLLKPHLQPSITHCGTGRRGILNNGVEDL